METKSEIFSKRLIIAVLWNIGLQTFLAVVLVFLIQIDFLHPVSWVTSTLHDIFGWKMGLNIVLLSLVSFFQAYAYGSYYMIPLPKYFTRFSMFLNMFSVQNTLFSILYALSGYFTMGLYSSLAKSNYNVLKKKCAFYDGQCLVEQSLFLQFGGMWMGLYYFMNTHIFGTTMLMFPHIYQDKFQQIKLAVNNILSMGFRNSIVPVVYYCFFYYFWGNKPRSVVSEVYSLYLEDPPLDNVVNLMRSGIWIGLWFYTSLFFVSVYTMRTIFNIILTEPMKFPIESANSLVLHNALALRSQFNGYLGAQDLRIMSMTDPARRQQIFTLSQPGGHPRNWNNLLEQCISIINDFSKELEAVNNGDGKSIEMENSTNRNIASSGNGFTYPANLRNMAQSPKLKELKDHNRNKQEDTFANVIKDEFNIFLQKLCQKPGISYLFGELTDTKLKFLLMQAQPVMWTCEGLACIASASLNEDKYGVVQNDLPIVISTLINLKHNLDKLTKPGLVPRKHILNDTFAIKMKTALISSVKRSIYKIAITFSKYIHEIPLDQDIMYVNLADHCPADQKLMYLKFGHFLYEKNMQSIRDLTNIKSTFKKPSYIFTKCLRQNKCYVKFFFIVSFVGITLPLIWIQYAIELNRHGIIQTKFKDKHKSIQHTYKFVNKKEEKLSEDIKFILVWTKSYRTLATFIAEGREIFQKNNCSVNKCYVTKDRFFFQSNITKFDAIAFIERDYNTSDMPEVRSWHQKYIYFNMESADEYPACKPQYDGFFNWTSTYRLDSDIPYPYILIRDKNGKIVGPKEKMQWKEDMAAVGDKLSDIIVNKTKAVAWFVSKCHSLGALQLVRELKYALVSYGLTLDVYRQCGTLKCVRRQKLVCDQMLKRDYFFILSIENTFAKDYVTNKLLRALQHDVIPIVYGGADYSRFLPPGSYINARKLNVLQLAATMNDLIHSPKQYSQYFRWKKYYTYHNPVRIENVCAMCEALHNKEKLRESKVYNKFRNWWNPNFKKRCYRLKCKSRYKNMTSHLTIKTTGIYC